MVISFELLDPATSSLVTGATSTQHVSEKGCRSKGGSPLFCCTPPFGGCSNQGGAAKNGGVFAKNGGVLGSTIEELIQELAASNLPPVWISIWDI